MRKIFEYFERGKYTKRRTYSYHACLMSLTGVSLNVMVWLNEEKYSNGSGMRPIRILAVPKEQTKERHWPKLWWRASLLAYKSQA
jgi:hypothetical protein